MVFIRSSFLVRLRCAGQQFLLIPQHRMMITSSPWRIAHGEKQPDNQKNNTRSQDIEKLLPGFRFQYVLFVFNNYMSHLYLSFSHYLSVPGVVVYSLTHTINPVLFRWLSFLAVVFLFLKFLDVLGDFPAILGSDL